jgi:xylan 1,4-beta-xylosidase
MINLTNTMLSLTLAACISFVSGKDAPIPQNPGGLASAMVTYLFSEPDGGDFALLLNHDDKGWQSGTLEQLALAVNKQKPSRVYVRMVVDHTSETINNFHFRIRHSGSFDLFLNGLKCSGSGQSSNEPKDYVIAARRTESIGKNLYAIRFNQIDPNGNFLEIAIKNAPFFCTDKSTGYPRPVIEDMVRDADACVAADGNYYLTATRGDDAFMMPGTASWLKNPGIEVYQSNDLKDWKSLGWVWTFDRDGTWNKKFGTFCGRGPARGIFAPEIKYFRDKYWISYSVNHATATHVFGIGILSADKPEGPYRDTSPDKPITDGYDSSLFIDDDDTVYLLKHGGLIAKMNADLSAVAEPFRQLRPANYPQVGYEGVHMFKYKGKYYLSAAEWNVHADGKLSYDSMIASADHVYGPFGDRYCAVRYGGNSSYFVGKDGQLYGTPWSYPESDYHWQRVSIVKIDAGVDGKLGVKSE